jgi:hypothetical protein
VRDVRVQLYPVAVLAVDVDVAVPVAVLQVTGLVQAPPAIVAVPGAQVILFLAGRAVVAELPRRHRQEQPVVTVDQLDVADDEGVVERQRAERLQSAPALAAEVDPYFRQFHDTPRDSRRERLRATDQSSPRNRLVAAET